MKFIHKQRFYKKERPFGTWKNGWIQTPQWILMDPCIKQAPVLSKQFWIIPWPLAYHSLDSITKIINCWYTFGWKWWVISFPDCLGLSNASSYDVIYRVDRFGFKKFCSPAFYHIAINIWAATWQNQQNDCAPSEDSDQPGHPPCLIRASTQPDQSLRCALNG